MPPLVILVAVFQFGCITRSLAAARICPFWITVFIARATFGTHQLHLGK
jgi:hypothetical protein